jgi:hypothetical protein
LFHTNKISNPSIEELRQKEKFEPVAELHHDQIKDFIRNQITAESTIMRIYMIYQIVMLLTGIYFSIRSIFLALHGNLQPFLIVLAGLAFTFTFLIIIHELLHAIALKLTGAGKISFGGFLKKFIFYAAADGFVMNSRQFGLVALTPFVVIKLLTLGGIIFLFNQDWIYFAITVMSAHSFFCAGDIILLAFFYRFPDSEIFTYDSKAENKSYFYREKPDKS